MVADRLSANRTLRFALRSSASKSGFDEGERRTDSIVQVGCTSSSFSCVLQKVTQRLLRVGEKSRRKAFPSGQAQPEASKPARMSCQLDGATRMGEFAGEICVLPACQ